MAIQNNFPSIRPSLNLDFANAKTLDPRITFTRASEARVYDGKTFAKAEENLLLQSEDFTTSWATINVTVAANTGAAPDGTTTADTITDNATSGVHGNNQVIIAVPNTVFTMSCFAKQGTNQFAFVSLSNTTAENYVSAIVDLAGGTITKSQSGTSTTSVSVGVSNAGNGWYRIFVTGASTLGFNRAYVGFSNLGSPTITNGGFPNNYSGTGSTILVWGAQLEQRSAVTAYTPTTTAPITNYIPVLQTAAANVARFDHNPVTGESLGLLIEEQRTNLVLHSQGFEQSHWTKSATTIASDVVVAPDGTLSADRIIETTATSAHVVRNQTAFAASTTYTASMYIKAGERTCGTMVVYDNASNIAGWHINLLTGEIVQGSITLTGTTAIATNVGNGWWRFSVTFTSTAAPSSQYFDFRISNIWPIIAGSGTSYTGNGYSGAYIWGAQLEVGSFPTSYIPTVAAQVTRQADAASMTGANFSSWYRQDEGTLFAEGAFIALVTARGFASLSDNTTSNLIQIQTHPSTIGSSRFNVTANGTAQAALGAASVFTAGVFGKHVGAYKVNDFAFASNGAAPLTDLEGTVPVVDRLRIGAYSAATSNCHIRSVRYYPARLTNTQLQAITTP
jgi:hypothetical protein